MLDIKYALMFRIIKPQKCISLYLPCTCFLIPSIWLDKHHTYFSQGSRSNLQQHGWIRIQNSKTPKLQTPKVYQPCTCFLIPSIWLDKHHTYFSQGSRSNLQQQGWIRIQREAQGLALAPV